MPRVSWLARDWTILRNYILTWKKKPFLASYKITHRCNLRCEQCPFHRLPPDQPTYSQVIATLDRLQQRGDRVVVFEGGEPMLWHDGSHTIHEVVEQAKARFFSVGMTTNGTYPLNAGVDTLWVSIDGLRETHNRLRNAEIFDRVINHILQSNHPRLFAHITVNNQNAAEIPALIQFLSALVKGITLQFYYPYQGAEAEAQADALFLDFERRAALLDELIALKRSGYPLLNSVPALEALKRNTWRCTDWLVDNANPDGSISQGCYLRGRADIDCARCGFSPFTELSLAYGGNVKAIQAGVEIFF